MTRMKKTAGVMAVLLLAACGSGELRGIDEGGGLGETGQSVSADLRLRGVPGHDFGAVLVSVADLMVTTRDGTRLPVSLSVERIDLGRGDHAWRLGRVELPQGIEQVQVSVRLDGYGGFDNGTASGTIETFGPELSFVASAAQMAATGKAVVDLDLARSIIETEGRHVLLPHLEIRY